MLKFEKCSEVNAAIAEFTAILCPFSLAFKVPLPIQISFWTAAPLMSALKKNMDEVILDPGLSFIITPFFLSPFFLLEKKMNLAQNPVFIDSKSSLHSCIIF